jgi:tetratricopeptide (TPR) repeat protein
MRFAELAASATGDVQLEARTQLARALGLQSRFDEARRVLAEDEPLLAGAGPGARVRHALELGRVENSSGNRAQATLHFLRARELADGARLDGLAVDAEHMLGISNEGEAALDWTRRALERAEASEDPSAQRWRASLANNLGWNLMDLERPAEALAEFQRALELREEQGEQEPIWIARWCVARCLRELDRTDEALAMQLALQAERDAAGSPDPYVDEELALLEADS